MTPALKLPAEVLAVHGDDLRSRDWTIEPILYLADAMPDGEFLDSDVIELTARGGSQVVRCRTLGASIRMRRYAERLHQLPKPTLEAIAAVLKARNPESE